MDKVAVISGFYGPDQNITFKGQRNKNYPSFFVTNNLKAAKKAENVGWNICFDDDAPVSDDKYISTMQGKKPKAVPSELIDLSEFDYTLWVDDKIKISDSMLINREIPRLKKNQNKASLRTHWKGSTKTVWKELALSLEQPRYKEFFFKYVDYINQKVSDGYSDQGTMTACGVILRNNKDPQVKKIFEEWFEEITRSGLANDQVTFFFIRQKYKIEISEMLFPLNYTQLYTQKLIDFKNYLVKKHFY
mgnify:CR=1 FL=1|tara:strand:+ start:1059 stop:1799 length:741 start_codon:yes stop_codon:yes gene_type:complete